MIVSLPVSTLDVHLCINQFSAHKLWVPLVWLHSRALADWVTPVEVLFAERGEEGVIEILLDYLGAVLKGQTFPAVKK